MVGKTAATAATVFGYTHEETVRMNVSESNQQALCKLSIRISRLCVYNATDVNYLL